MGVELHANPQCVSPSDITTRVMGGGGSTAAAENASPDDAYPAVGSDKPVVKSAEPQEEEHTPPEPTPPPQPTPPPEPTPPEPPVPVPVPVQPVIHVSGDEAPRVVASDAFAVRPIDGRGLAAIARRNIDVNELVICEQPLLRLTPDGEGRFDGKYYRPRDDARMRLLSLAQDVGGAQGDAVRPVHASRVYLA